MEGWGIGMGGLVWEPMMVSDVFEEVMMSPTQYNQHDLGMVGEPVAVYVTRSQENNGVTQHVPTQDREPIGGGAITVGGATATVFYQLGQFYTGQDVLVLRHPKMVEASALMLVALLRAQVGKFSWGSHGVTLTRLRRLRMMVPVTMVDEVPQVDWAGLQALGEHMLGEVRGRIPLAMFTPSAPPNLNMDSPVVSDLIVPSNSLWEPVKVEDVFEVCRQNPSWLYVKNIRDRQEGTLFPLVTNTLTHNSVHRFIGAQDEEPNHGNAITVGVDCQAVTYQGQPFYGGEGLLELRHPSLTAASALVLVALLRQAVEVFSWHHKSSLARLRRTRIMVPVIPDGTGMVVVDWGTLHHIGCVLLDTVEERIGDWVNKP
jgi:hypothetical protein